MYINRNQSLDPSNDVIDYPLGVELMFVFLDGSARKISGRLNTRRDSCLKVPYRILIVLIFFMVTLSIASDDWLLPWKEATVMIVGGNAPGDSLILNRRANATGFLVQHHIDDNYLPPLVITCRHVVDSLTANFDAVYFFLYSDSDDAIDRTGGFYVLFNQEQSSPSAYSFIDYDISAFILDTANVIQNRGILNLLSPFDFSRLRSVSMLNEGDRVAILGYPGSILRSYPWTERPLLRMGAISWLSSDTIPHDFLIDIPTHPGYSGSPVIFIEEYSPNTLNPEPVSFAGIQTSAIAYRDTSILAGHTGLASVVPSDIVVLLCNWVYGIFLSR